MDMLILKTLRPIAAMGIVSVLAIASPAADEHRQAPPIQHGSSWLRPRWTRARPHFERRRGKTFAVAVGKARDKENRALARATAEERASADLVRLIQGKAPDANTQGRIVGAAPIAIYETGNGTVFVRVEMETPARARL